MRLTREQDGVMNAIFSNIQSLAEARDLVVGSPLTRQDMQRIAAATLEDINTLWGQIGAAIPTLGYAPCPWNERHIVEPIGERAEYLHCSNGNCPMHAVRITRADWNRRE